MHEEEGHEIEKPAIAGRKGKVRRNALQPPTEMFRKGIDTVADHALEDLAQKGSTTMKLVETAVTESAVRIRFADDADRLRARSWIECQIQRWDLKHLNGTPVENLASLSFPMVRQVILENAQAVLAAEIERLRAS